MTRAPGQPLRVSAALCALLAALAAGCDCRECAPPVTAQAGSAPAWADAPAVPPVAFFERACANCHGPGGMFYGEGFAAMSDDAELARVVHEMVIGPARTTLDDASTAALVAYHRHLRESVRRPFVVLTRIDGGRVEGEVSGGSRVVVVADGREVEATVVDHAWSVVLTGPPRASLVVRARADGEPTGETELDLGRAAWTHDAPPESSASSKGGA